MKEELKIMLAQDPLPGGTEDIPKQRGVIMVRTLLCCCYCAERIQNWCSCVSTPRAVKYRLTASRGG